MRWRLLAYSVSRAERPSSSITKSSPIVRHHPHRQTAEKGGLADEIYGSFYSAAGCCHRSQPIDSARRISADSKYKRPPISEDGHLRHNAKHELLRRGR